jgi:hypothetical protein
MKELPRFAERFFFAEAIDQELSLINTAQEKGRSVQLMSYSPSSRTPANAHRLTKREKTAAWLRSMR